LNAKRLNASWPDHLAAAVNEQAGRTARPYRLADARPVQDVRDPATG
jgi:hypothetical protein